MTGVPSAKLSFMKKFILLIIVFIIAGILAYKLLSDKNKTPGPPPDPALRISKNTGPFNTAFAGLMNEYFDLRDALVNWDTLKADQAAYAVAAKADSLPVKTVKGDSSLVLTAESLAASIVGEAKGLTGETGIEGRRRSFNMLTDELYNLIRTVRYDGGTIYHMNCAAAFSDSTEGTWLSLTPAIVNPYFGNKDPKYQATMLGNGEITDSVNYSK